MGKKHSNELNVKVVDYPNMVYATWSKLGLGIEEKRKWDSGFRTRDQGTDDDDDHDDHDDHDDAGGGCGDDDVESADGQHDVSVYCMCHFW